MKNYYIQLVEAYGNTVHFTIYGRLTEIMVNDKLTKCIVNEHNVPMYISTLNTISIRENQN